MRRVSWFWLNFQWAKTAVVFNPETHERRYRCGRRLLQRLAELCLAILRWMFSIGWVGGANLSLVYPGDIHACVDKSPGEFPEPAWRRPENYCFSPFCSPVRGRQICWQELYNKIKLPRCQMERREQFSLSLLSRYSPFHLSHTECWQSIKLLHDIQGLLNLYHLLSIDFTLSFIRTKKWQIFSCKASLNETRKSFYLSVKQFPRLSYDKPHFTRQSYICVDIHLLAFWCHLLSDLLSLAVP